MNISLSKHLRRCAICLGKIGTTFKKAFENIGLNVMVSDHKTKDQENDLIKKSEWIILCVPIDKTLEVFDRIKNKIRKDL